MNLIRKESAFWGGSIFGIVLGFYATYAQAADLIVNGGFESGFTGWTVADQAGGSGSFYINSGNFSPVSGFATVGAASGTQYGISDQSGPGAHALVQSFTVAPGSTVNLSFQMFDNDQSGLGPLGSGLDYTAVPNQHVQVDILSGSAGALDNGAGVLSELYYGSTLLGPNAYVSYSFDITGLVGAGGTFQVRFGEVDNQFYNQMGVDNVSIQATSGVPDGGSTLAFLGGTLTMLGAYSRRFRK